MGIRVLKVPDFKLKSKQLRDKWKIVLAQEMELALSEIKIQTSRGVDVEGREFKPYSPEYADFKESTGRKSSPVDLTFTGLMLKAIQVLVKETPQSILGRIYFASDEEAAKGRWNNARREFFALSQQRVNRILRALSGRTG